MITDEIQQKIAVSDHYDPKHILNTAPTKIIPFSLLQEAEGRGIDSEKLQSLGMPIYFYRTQITIHGIPEGNIDLVYGYKSIIRNLNGSIGVKYSAIDAFKKMRLSKYLKEYSWSTHRNSTEFYFVLYSAFQQNIESLIPAIKDFMVIYNRIDRNLFYGQIVLNTYYSNIFGYYAALILRIGAINSTNVIPLVECITGDSIVEIESKIRQKEEDEIKASLAMQAEMEARQEQRKALVHKIIQMYADKWINSPTSGVYIQVAPDYNLNIIYRKVEFKKRANTLYRRVGSLASSIEEARDTSLSYAKWKKYAASSYKVLPYDTK
ncbi:MAG: hypothetical protein AB1478_02775 [Nitrospirota bacterium]